MATIKAILRSSAKEAFLRFRLSDGRSKQLFYKSTILIEVALWDSKRECISTRKICDSTYRQQTNDKIHDIKSRILLIYERNKQQIATSADLAAFIEGKRFAASVPPIVNFCDLITAYVEANKDNLSRATKGHYKSVRTIYKRYMDSLTAEGKTNHFARLQTLKEADFIAFANFVRDEYRYVVLHPTLYNEKPFADMGKKGRSPKIARSANTINGYLKKTKVLLKWAKEKGFISVNPMENYKIKAEVYGTPYYLTKEERNKIFALNLSTNKDLERIRDLFIFQCFVGCRYGDLNRLKRENFADGYLEYIPNKTKGKKAKCISVPLHPIAQKILKRYEEEKRPLPTPICLETFNRKIKVVFTMANIKRKVTILDPHTNEEVHKPLNEVASSHLARRTFIGILYKQIRDPNLISALSGHALNSAAFARYRTIDNEIKKETILLLE